MFKKRGIIGIGLVIIIFLSFYFDYEIVKALSLIRGEILNEIFIGVTFASSGVIIFFISTSLFLWKEHKRKYILPLWLTFLASIVISSILKIIVQRQRPYQLGLANSFPLLEKAAHLSWDFSFPSFQAMLAFSAIPILSKEFPKFKYFWIFFATLVVISRVYFGVHFASDVIIGAIIGYGIGWTILKLEDKNKFAEKFYRKIKK
ncbi:MAG: phosphatase PAP2 family protein [archaeon]